MRILLHDTSHNLEKFSDRVDKLTSGIDETKEEIIAVHRSFQGDREELSGEILDLGKYQSPLRRSAPLSSRI
jgi:predicted  nucleic acid-binding Zn-ribbon protein